MKEANYLRTLLEPRTAEWRSSNERGQWWSDQIHTSFGPITRYLNWAHYDAVLLARAEAA